MSASATVRDVVREAIRSGKLPDRQAERTWGGRGCGATCAICEQPVNPDELEYELEFDAGDDGTEQANYHVHTGCFWDLERERRRLEAERTRDTELPGVVAEARLDHHDRKAAGRG